MATMTPTSHRVLPRPVTSTARAFGVLVLAAGLTAGVLAGLSTLMSGWT